MTWLTPTLGAIAAAVLVPSLIILYFLKLRRRDVEVSTTLLWKKSIQDLQANAPFQKLRRNLLLFLQLLALAAGLLAVAQPQWRAAGAPPARSVIIIDRSASMSAMDAKDDDGRTISRLDRAKAEARAFVDRMPERGLLGELAGRGADEAMVIAFDSTAEVVQAYTPSKAALRAAIDSIQPTDAPTSFAEVMRVGQAFLSASRIQIDERDVSYKPGAPMILFSDGAVPDLDDIDIHPETTVQYHRFGAAGSANIAITSIRAERAYDRPGEAAVFVGVQSTDSSARSVDVELLINGDVAGVRELTIPGAPSPAEPATGGLVFRLDRQESALITARLSLDASDALAADNTAWVILPPARRFSVALVTEAGNLFVRRALRAMPLSKFEVMAPADFEALAREERLGEFDVFVLDRWCPTADPAAGASPALPAGKYLFLGVVPPIRGLTSLGPTGGDESGEEIIGIIDWDRNHPALKLVNMENVYIASMNRAEASDQVQVLATSTAGPALIEAVQEATRSLILTFNPADSTWPFDAGFVLFLAGAVRYLGEDAGVTGPLGVEALRPGRTLSTELPAGVRHAELALPGGEKVRLSATVETAGGRVSYGPLRDVGIYTLTWDGPPGPRDIVVDGKATRVFAVNLVDPFESRIESREKIDLPIKVVAATNTDAGSVKNALPLWSWLMLGSLAVIILEWWVYNRRVYL